MNLTGKLRLEIQKARSDVFVWGLSTWTGYRFGGPADSATSGVEWLDVLGTTHDIKIQRGVKRDGVVLALEAGMLTATVLDATVDPNTNPYFKPGTPLRLIYNGGLGDVPVFTGALRQVQVTYKGGKPRVFLSAVDRTKELANISRSGGSAGTFSERVADLLGKHGIPYVVSGTTPLHHNAFDSNILEHLTVASTSAQGAFYLDKGNVVKAYGKNALAAVPTNLYFTDQKSAGGEARINLISNPNFETNLTGWQAARGTTTRVLANAALSGDYIGRYTPDGTAGTNYTYITATGIQEGETYTASAYVRPKSTNNMRVNLQWRNASNAILSTSTGASTAASPMGWTRINVTGTAPVGATSVLVMVYFVTSSMASTEYFDLDAVMMEKGSAVLDYFDGASSYATWDGAVNGSTSTLHVDKIVEYTDIQVAYDSASVVNDLMIENLSRGYDEDLNPLSVHEKFGPYRNATSIATHGAYTEGVVTNLPNELDIADFAASVLNDNDTPELRVDSVTWNAFKRPEQAANAEILDTVRVEYTNEAIHIDELFSVLSLEHNISASNADHKWTVRADLIKEIGGS